MVSTLSLRSLLTHPDIRSGDIEFNWAALGIWGAEVKAALEAGAVYITDLTIDENGMTLTLSNGNLVGPAPIQPTLPRPMGPWAEGVSYKKADFVRGPAGLLIVQADHLSSDDLDADIADGKLAYYAANGEGGGGGGGGGGGDIYATVSSLDLLVAYTGTVGYHMVPVDCALVAGKPIRARLMAALPPGSADAEVEVSLKHVGGSSETLGVLTFTDANDIVELALDEDLAAGDVLVFEQQPYTDPPPAGQFVISLTLVPA